QLGDKTTTMRTTPVATDTSGVLASKPIIGIAAGMRHSTTFSNDGQIYAWGLNTYGQLGDGGVATRLTPVAVDMSGALDGKTISDISAGNDYSIGLTRDSQVYAWGYNSFGQLGDGTMASRNRAV